MAEHELKTWRSVFGDVLDGSKTFELRKDDRGFAVGDTLVLREWDMHEERYTGRQCERRVTYILRGKGDGHADRGSGFGLPSGMVIMSLESSTPMPSAAMTETKAKDDHEVRVSPRRDDDAAAVDGRRAGPGGEGSGASQEAGEAVPARGGEGRVAVARDDRAGLSAADSSGETPHVHAWMEFFATGNLGIGGSHDSIDHCGECGAVRHTYRISGAISPGYPRIRLRNSSEFTRPAYGGTRMCPSCGVSVEVDGQACEPCSSRATKGPAR